MPYLFPLPEPFLSSSARELLSMMKTANYDDTIGLAEVEKQVPRHKTRSSESTI